MEAINIIVSTQGVIDEIYTFLYGYNTNSEKMARREAQNQFIKSILQFHKNPTKEDYAEWDYDEFLDYEDKMGNSVSWANSTKVNKYN